MILCRVSPVPQPAKEAMEATGKDSGTFAAMAVDITELKVESASAKIRSNGTVRDVTGFAVTVSIFVPKEELDILPTRLVVLPNGQVDPSTVGRMFPFGGVVHLIVPRDRLPPATLKALEAAEAIPTVVWPPDDC